MCSIHLVLFQSVCRGYLPVNMCEMTNKDKQTLTARSRRWRVLSVSIFVLMLDYGFLYALGTMFVPMLDSYGENRGKTAAVQSVYNGVTFMSSTFTGLVVSKWGPSCGMLLSSVLIPVGFFASFFAKSLIHLYVSLGIIAGIGSSFVFVSSVVSVGQAFPKSQRAFALSLQMTLIGLASIAYPYFLNWLLDIYGLNGTFLLLSGLYLNTFIAAIIYRYEVKPTAGNISKSNERLKDDVCRNTAKREGNPGNINDEGRETAHACESTTDNCENDDVIIDLNQGLCSATYIFFAAASSLLIGNITGFVTIAQDIYVAKGLSIPESLTGFLVFNISNALSRLAPGITAKLSMSCFTTSLIAPLFGLAGQLSILFSDSFISIMMGSGLSGAALGGYASSVVTVTFELLGPSRQAIGFGIIVTINGISVTCVGPSFGAIRDATGEYENVLKTTACLNAACFILICIVILTIYLHKQRLKKKVKQNNSQSM